VFEQSGTIPVIYSFRGVQREMDLTFPPVDGEQIRFAGMMRKTRRGLVARPCLVRVSSLRICIVEHYAFRRDVGIQIFAADLQRLDLGARSVAFRWSSPNGNGMARLTTWSGPTSSGRPVRDIRDIREAFSGYPQFGG
jgi:hypothetical protein